MTTPGSAATTQSTPAPRRIPLSAPWLVFLVVAVTGFLWVHLFPPAATGPSAVVSPNSDAFMYHLPVRAYAFSELRAGRLPLWNPYVLGGQPFLATHQHALLYPGNLPHWFLSPDRALGLVMALHVLWATVGMFVWLRFWNLPPAARTIGGLVFGLATCVVNPLQWPHVVLGNAWLPWVCAGVDGTVARPGARRAAWLAAASTCLLLAGYIQGAVYIYYAAAPYALLRWWQTRDADRARRGWWLVAGMLLLPVMTAAVQLLPLMELAGRSARPPGGLDPAAVAALGYVPGREIARALFRAGGGAGNALTLTVAPLVWMLGVPALLRRDGRGRLLCWLGIGVLATVLAAGFDTPLYRVYFAIPTGGVFRLPVRLLVLTACALAVFAATGAAVLLDRTARPHPLILGAGILLGVLASTRQIAVGLVSAALVATWGLWPRGRTACAVGAAALLAWSAVRAYQYNVYLPWHGPDPFPPHDGVVTFLREHLGHDRVHIQRADGDWRTWTYPANWGMTARVRQLTAYESLPLQRTADAFNHLQFGGPPSSPVPFVGGLELTPDAPHVEWFHLWSVRWVIVDGPAASADWLQRRLELQRVRVGAETLLHNPHALPRAYWVPRARPVHAGDATWRALAAPEFDPRAEVLIGDTDAVPAATDMPNVVDSADVAVTFLADRATNIRLSVSSPADGWVVLTDAWYPGWQATVNGARTPIHLANGVFRAVRVGQGATDVAFRYRSPVVRAGAVASLTGIVLLAACAILPGYRRSYRINGGPSVGLRN